MAIDSHKKLIEELKKYNKDLEKHIPNLDLDFIKGLSTSDSEHNESIEYYALLANNMAELRTEMALIRKNMTTDVENMVMRMVNDSQNKFFEQIRKFYGVMVMEIKDDFYNNMKNLSDDINNLKRKYNDTSIQVENLSEAINSIVSDVKETRSNTRDIETLTSQISVSVKNDFDDTFELIHKIDSKLNKLNNELKDSIIESIPKPEINREDLQKIENSILEIKPNRKNVIDEVAEKEFLNEIEKLPDFSKDLDSLKKKEEGYRTSFDKNLMKENTGTTVTNSSVKKKNNFDIKVKKKEKNPLKVDENLFKEDFDHEIIKTELNVTNKDNKSIKKNIDINLKRENKTPKSKPINKNFEIKVNRKIEKEPIKSKKNITSDVNINVFERKKELKNKKFVSQNISENKTTKTLSNSEKRLLEIENRLKNL